MLKQIWCFFLYVVPPLTLLPSSIQAQSDLLATPITLDYRETLVSEILTEISLEYTIPISYSPSRVPVFRKVNLQVTKRPLSEVLDTLFANSSVTYELVSGQVLLMTDAEDAAEVKPLSFMVKGYLKSATTQKGIPYAHVYLAHTAQGKVSDKNGYFELRLPESFRQDTLVFSSIGYSTFYLPLASRDVLLDNMTILLQDSTYTIQDINIYKKRSRFWMISDRVKVVAKFNNFLSNMKEKIPVFLDSLDFRSLQAGFLTEIRFWYLKRRIENLIDKLEESKKVESMRDVIGRIIKKKQKMADREIRTKTPPDSSDRADINPIEKK